jgi:hypothetical protein
MMFEPVNKFKAVNAYASLLIANSESVDPTPVPMALILTWVCDALTRLLLNASPTDSMKLIQCQVSTSKHKGRHIHSQEFLPSEA